MCASISVCSLCNHSVLTTILLRECKIMRFACFKRECMLLLNLGVRACDTFS